MLRGEAARALFRSRHVSSCSARHRADIVPVCVGAAKVSAGDAERSSACVTTIGVRIAKDSAAQHCTACPPVARPPQAVTADLAIAIRGWREAMVFAC